MSKEVNNLLIPNVTSLPQEKAGTKANTLKPGQSSEFQSLFNEQIGNQTVNQGINLSSHAAKRINERQIDIDNGEYLKLKEAIGKLKSKGGKDSLVVTEKAAYIVDVPNNKIVTAINKESLAENVFTKIDSTLFMM